MASGFSSVHPVTENLLKLLGVKNWQVTQGVGYAKASAGFHEPISSFNGRVYGTCVDLDIDLADPEFLCRCWVAGLIAFVRNGSTGWSGSEHIHAVHIGLKNSNGEKKIFGGPDRQIKDFLKNPPRSGLASHGYLLGYKPTENLQTYIKNRLYNPWHCSYPTIIKNPEGVHIPCFGLMDGESVTVEVRSFVEFYGLKIVGDSKNIDILNKGNELKIDKSGFLFDGSHWRAPVRTLWESFGNKKVSFNWIFNNTAAEVSLGY